MLDESEAKAIEEVKIRWNLEDDDVDKITIKTIQNSLTYQTILLRYRFNELWQDIKDERFYFLRWLAITYIGILIIYFIVK